MYKTQYNRCIGSFGIIVLLVFLILAGTSIAQSSENYVIKKWVLDQAGGISSSAGYSVQDAAGQPSVIGNMSSTSYSVSSGFWGEGVIETGLDVEQRVDMGLPEKFELKQNYPNPFNPITSICYALPEPALVNLYIYNMQGQLVDVLVSELKSAGFYTVLWNASRFGSGVYIYRIEAGSWTETMKCLLVK